MPWREGDPEGIDWSVEDQVRESEIMAIDKEFVAIDADIRALIERKAYLHRRLSNIANETFTSTRQ